MLIDLHSLVNTYIVIINQMKILFVLECANQPTNGTTASCIRFAKELEKRGHEVSIIGCDRIVGERYHRYFGLPKYHFPVTDPLIVKDGFLLVKCIYKTIFEALKGQDLVHFFLPFKLHNVCRILAQEQGIPVTGAFHIVPQNVTSAMHLGKARFINWVLLLSFRRYIYNQVRHIHVPSKMAADLMKKHHFKHNVAHVISNGVIPFYKKLDNVEKPKELKGKFIVCMAARLADEKRQDLIVKGVAKSKYNNKIQIILCGQGANKDRLLKLANKRKVINTPIIKFCNQEELRNIFNYIDLYIHASDFEIEGISAIEAISCGAVPLVSDSPYCATKDFALDKKHCLFKHGSPKDLAKKLDWLYEHDEERRKLSDMHHEYSKNFALEDQVTALENMFKLAIKEKEEGKDLHTVSPRKKDQRLLKRYMRQAKKQEKHPEKYLKEDK